MVEGLLRSRSAYPADLYTPSSRAYEPPPEPEYPFHDRTVRVTRCGRICVGKRKINLSNVFAGQLVGNREVEDRIWLVSLLHYDLGYYDHEEGRIEPVPTPSGIHAENWKDGGESAAQRRASQRDYAIPNLGRKRVDGITTVDVMAALLPIWSTKRETARRIRQRIGARHEVGRRAGLPRGQPGRRHDLRSPAGASALRSRASARTGARQAPTRRRCWRSSSSC